MRVLWPHNFDSRIPNAGSFMYTSAEALREIGVEPHLMELGDLRSPRRLMAARAAVAEKAPSFDVVHSQFGSACAVATLGAKKVPKVLSLRGSDWSSSFETKLKWRLHSQMATRMTRHALPSFDVVVTVSERMSGEVLTEFPSAPVFVAPSAIDTALFTQRDKATVRKSLGLDPDAKYVLFTSMVRDRPLKRVWLAEEAIEIARSHPGNSDIGRDWIPSRANAGRGFKRRRRDLHLGLRGLAQLDEGSARLQRAICSNGRQRPS